MHPALMIAVMEERDRELARRTKDAWKRPAPPRKQSGGPGRDRHRNRHGRGRIATAFARSVAFFG
jgi:hypothetical protein